MVAGAAVMATVLGQGDPSRTNGPGTADTLEAATASAAGVELSCVDAPSRCGYPDATNSGVPSGTPLVGVPSSVSAGDGWRVHPDGWLEIHSDGAVLQRIVTDLPVQVMADDVLIREVVITAEGDVAGIGLRGAEGTTIESSTIGPPDGTQRLKYGIQDVDGNARLTRIIGNEILGVATAIAVHEGVVAENYVHGLRAAGDDHVNGIVSNGSTQPLSIRGNTVLNPLDQTDAVALFQDFGVEANTTVTGNLLAGGSYSLYAGGPREGGPLSWNIVVTDNRFSRVFHPGGGVFGPATSFDREGAGNVWEGNLWDETGAAVPPP